MLQASHVCGCTNHIQDTYKASPALFYVSSDTLNRAKVYQGQLCVEDMSCLTSVYLQCCYSEIVLGKQLTAVCSVQLRGAPY